jgi:hypothetical protein
MGSMAMASQENIGHCAFAAAGFDTPPTVAAMTKAKSTSTATMPSIAVAPTSVTTSKKRLPDWLRLVLVAMLSAG